MQPFVLALLFVAFLIAPCLAAPPEIVRVRVPSAKIGEVFPAGTEIRILSADEFEKIVKEANDGISAARQASSPRILNVRHRARLDGGILSGRSEFTIERSQTGGASIVLAPWSPAVDPAQSDRVTVMAVADGRAVIRLDPGDRRTVGLAWKLVAREGSEGRVFSLGLPHADLSSLELDLPAGTAPEGAGGVRQGPLANREPGRSTWRIDGTSGLLSLRLIPSDTAQGSGSPKRAWAGGNTHIEVSGSTARWRAEWNLGVDARVGRFEMELDPGLELLDVRGPAIGSFRTSPRDGRTMLSIRLLDEDTVATPITVEAIAKVPDEGTWPLPAARPLDAAWTGGRTIVQVDPSHVVEECRERGGFRIPAASSEASSSINLEFESTSSNSVADLRLARPTAEIAAEIRGQLLLGRDSTRIEAEVMWRVHRGRLLVATVDLPADWTPDRVQPPATEGSLNWVVEPRTGGGSRIVIRPARARQAKETLVVSISAIASRGPGAGRVAPPRVLPVGVPIVEDLWTAYADSHLRLRPIEANGLSWIEASTLPAQPGTSSLSAVLAWRWTSPDGKALFETSWRPNEPSYEVSQDVIVSENRLLLDVRISINGPDSPLRSLLLDSSSEAGPGWEWRLRDEADGPPLLARPIRSDRSEILSKPVWQVDFPQPRRGRIDLETRVVLPWSGAGAIPIVGIADRAAYRGTVRIFVEGGMRTSVETEGLLPLEPSFRPAAAVATAAGESDAATSRRRLAHVFGFQGRSRRLHLRTERLEPLSVDGFVSEARLRSILNEAGPVQHELDITVVGAGGRSLSLTLPGGGKLERLLVDQREVAPYLLDDRHLRIPIGPAARARSSCSVRLEYTTAEIPVNQIREQRPLIPEFNIPCLDFLWELTLPRDARPGAPSPELVALDPHLHGSESFAPFRSGRWPSVVSDKSTSEGTMRRDIESLVPSRRLKDARLGDLLTRCDAGRWRVVVDQVALKAGGWQPGSRLALDQVAAPPDATLLERLRKVGIAIVPVGNCYLTTSVSEVPDGRGASLDDPDAAEAWSSAIRSAATEGSDASGRFRSAAQWCLEGGTGGRSFTAEVGEPPETADRRAFRYRSLGWPSSAAWTRINRDRASLTARWGTSLAVMLIAVALRTASSPLRMRVVCVLVPAALLVLNLPEPWGEIGKGTMIGLLAAVGFWLGGRRTSRTTGSIHADASSEAKPRRQRQGSASGKSGVALSLLALAALNLSVFAQEDSPAASNRPIMAIFADEDLAEAARGENRRVVIRLEDDARLRALATPRSSASESMVGITEASHRLKDHGPRSVLIESTYHLRNDSTEPRSWPLPLGPVKDTTASLDGTEIAIAVQGGDRPGVIPAIPPGVHVLRVARTAVKEKLGDADYFTVPVNPVPTATILCEGGRPERSAYVVSARGPTAPEDGGIGGLLGPAESIVIRWKEPEGRSAARPKGAAEAILLWDAEPAGDRLRARVTVPRATDLTRLRIGTDPGWVVTSASIPGFIDSTWTGPLNRPEWNARLEPIRGDLSFQIELWRPLDAAHADGTRPSEDAGRPFPRFELRDVETFTGIVGFRRPPGWSGRLRAVAGTDAIDDQAFLQDWGTLPDAKFSLAGAIRYAIPPRIDVRCAAVRPRFSVRPTTRLEILPGKVAVRTELAFTDLSRGPSDLTVVLPANMQVEQIESPGLTTWSRPARDRLHLHFEGVPEGPVSVLIRGWIGIESDALKPGTARHELPTPWIYSQGADQEPGILYIVASPRLTYRIQGAKDVVPAPLASPATGTATEPRGRYLVDGRRELGTLWWEDEPPKSQVTIASLLTLHPSFAEWHATAEYLVTAGPLDRLSMRLPAAWANEVTVEIPGVPHRLERLTEDNDSVLTVRPDAPIWGAVKLSIHGSRPLTGMREILFPDLVPLGRGTADTHIALANATGHPVTTQGSAGLQPVDLSRFRNPTDGNPIGTIVGVFHVLKDGWTLGIQSAEERSKASAEDDFARARSADTTATLMADGRLWADSRYEIEPASGAFLPLTFRAPGEAYYAFVDGLPVRPLRSASGRILIPITNRHARDVHVIWGSRSVKGPRGLTQAVQLPALEQSRVPTSATIYAPSTFDVSAVAEQASPGMLEARRCEALAGRIAATVLAMDRGSARDRSALLADCISFELLARSAPLHTGGREARARVEDRLRLARATLSEALQSAGLEEFSISARARTGIEGDVDPLSGTPDPSFGRDPELIPHVGMASAYQTTALEKGRGMSIVWSERADRGRAIAPYVLPTLACSAIALIVFVAAGRLASLGSRLASLALFVPVLAAAVAIGPYATLPVVVLFVAGRSSFSG